MSEQITISAVVTTDLKRQLEQWATQEDRTVSATLRQILAQEAKRRAAQIGTRQQVATH